MRLEFESINRNNFREVGAAVGVPMAQSSQRDAESRAYSCCVFCLEGEQVSKRKRKQGMMLFSPEGEGTCRAIRRVGMEECLEKEALGFWERVYDRYTGELMGFRMKARKEVDDSALKSQPTPAAIAPAEMELNAFAQAGFTDARSHTARLKEADRLSREKSGREPEDKIERTLAKVIVWPKVGAAKGDILRAWPRGASA
jgi:hypothetical protein